MRQRLINCGFEDQILLIEAGKCPFCQKQIDKSQFKDEKSIDEYNISGMCQKCQDELLDGFYAQLEEIMQVEGLADLVINSIELRGLIRKQEIDRQKKEKKGEE